MHIEISAPRIAGILIILCIYWSFLPAQEQVPPIRIMFWNVENLFDIYNDPLTSDDDFLPDGVMRWNYSRYNRKINSVYKVITAAGGWDPPAIVAFCEVENRKVIEDLIDNTYLSGYGYEIVHEESPDERGIDVCLIYRKSVVNIPYFKYLTPERVTCYTSRSVLYARCVIMKDTINLFVNHWPSRRGGVLAGESLRLDISDMVRNAADSLDALSGRLSKTIILGDFNCVPEDHAIERLVKGRDSDKTGECGFLLVNLAETAASGGHGTYRYRGIWEMLDQIIVSPWLTGCKSGLTADKGGFRIFRPDFLLKTDPAYPGTTTFSTYRGYRYQGGFSDHLPVLLDLDLVQEGQLDPDQALCLFPACIFWQLRGHLVSGRQE